jgi:hypothetical protein
LKRKSVGTAVSLVETVGASKEGFVVAKVGAVTIITTIFAMKITSKGKTEEIVFKRSSKRTLKTKESRLVSLKSRNLSHCE